MHIAYVLTVPKQFVLNPKSMLRLPKSLEQVEDLLLAVAYDQQSIKCAVFLLTKKGGVVLPASTCNFSL